IVPARGQDHGTAQRPNDRSEWCEDVGALPRSLASRQLLRPRDVPAVGVLDQQLRPARIDDREDLSVSLASGALLSLDQAAFENKGIVWDIAECREDAGMDRDLRLCTGGHRSQGIEAGALAGRNPANSERFAFRENPCF